MRKIATLLGLGLALVTALALMWWIELGKLDKEALERKQASNLVEQENDELKSALEREKEKSADLEEDVNEVHRLRGEVTRLTRVATEIERIKAELDRLDQENQSLRRDRDAGTSGTSLASGAEGEESNHVPVLILKEDLVFRGNDTPEDTLASFLSSMLEANFANMGELFVPELQEEWFEGLEDQTDEELEEGYNEMQKGINQLFDPEYFTGVQVISSTQISDDTIQMDVLIKGMGESPLAQEGSDGYW